MAAIIGSAEYSRNVDRYDDARQEYQKALAEVTVYQQFQPQVFVPRTVPWQLSLIWKWVAATYLLCAQAMAAVSQTQRISLCRNVGVVAFSGHEPGAVGLSAEDDQGLARFADRITARFRGHLQACPPQQQGHWGISA